MNYGYIKVASAIPSVKVGDCQFNLQEIEQMIARAEGQGVAVLSFFFTNISVLPVQLMWQSHVWHRLLWEAFIPLME